MKNLSNTVMKTEKENQNIFKNELLIKNLLNIASKTMKENQDI